MLFAVSGLRGCPVKAGDGLVGSVKDFLFDDRSWKVRWMVVDTGHWLPGRQVLIHPSAIAPLEPALPVKRVLPMMTTGDTLVVSVRLTKEQIEASPDARQDEPVTKQMETDVYDHYGWDPAWEPHISEQATSPRRCWSRWSFRRMQRVRRRTGKAIAARAIRICAASSQSTAITSTQPTAPWAT